MADDLIGRMLGFGSVIRPYMNQQIAEVLTRHDLSERDLQILEFVAAQTSPAYNEVAGHVQAWHGPGASSSRLSTAISALFTKHEVIKKELNPKNQR